jgi:hypothetical protein
MRRQHVAYRRERLLGTTLLDDADRGIDQHDGEDDDAVDHMPEQQHRGAGKQQRVDEQIVKLREPASPPATLGSRRKRIGTDARKPRCGLVAGEARFLGLHALQRLGHRLCMPQHLRVLRLVVARFHCLQAPYLPEPAASPCGPRCAMT